MYACMDYYNYYILLHRLTLSVVKLASFGYKHFTSETLTFTGCCLHTGAPK